MDRKNVCRMQYLQFVIHPCVGYKQREMMDGTYFVLVAKIFDSHCK